MADALTPFESFLEAKRTVDEVSINRDVAELFEASLSELGSADVLDLGTGTGAAIRRLLRSRAVRTGRIVGLDADARLLGTARRYIRDELEKLYGAVRETHDGFSMSGADAKFEVTLIEADALTDGPITRVDDRPFDAVTAHSFMDIVPLEPVVRRVRSVLRPGGLFYATMNYDGVTELVPSYPDVGFEDDLLAIYDRSMDDRRVNGVATGGSRSAVRLATAVAAVGFQIIGYGPSDWSIFPWGGNYASGHERYLAAMLETIAAEGRKHAELDRARIDAWLAARLRAVEERTVSLVVHQCDLLARR